MGEEDMSTFLFAYHQHLCTPFISSSLTAGLLFLSHMPRSYIARGVDDRKRCKYTLLFKGVRSEWLEFSVIASRMSACEGLFLPTILIWCLCSLTISPSLLFLHSHLRNVFVAPAFSPFSFITL
jgi:hypothetical protein